MRACFSLSVSTAALTFEGPQERRHDLRQKKRERRHNGRERERERGRKRVERERLRDRQLQVPDGSHMADVYT